MVQVTTPDIDAINRVIDSIASKVKTLQDDVNTHTESRNLRLRQSLTEVYDELRLLPLHAARVAQMVVRNFIEDGDSIHSILYKHEIALEEIVKQADDAIAHFTLADAIAHFTLAAQVPLPEDLILSEAEVDAGKEANHRVKIAKLSMKDASASWCR